MLRFKAAYVSGPPAGAGGSAATRAATVQGILPFTISEVQTIDRRPTTSPRRRERPSTRAEESRSSTSPWTDGGPGTPAHQVWLPPLDVPDTLDQLMGDLTEDPELGLVSPDWRRLGGLVCPFGTVDRPREQRRDTLTINLGRAAGHVAVVGGPRSGKSTLLRTIVTSMSLTTTPQESQFFVLDFGGGTFAPLARLPHVAGVGTRSEPDVVRRLVAEVSGSSTAARRTSARTASTRSRPTGAAARPGRADDGYGDVFLVVDGWNTLRSDFDDLETEIQQLAARGLTFGLHVVDRERAVGGLPGLDARRVRHPPRAAARRPVDSEVDRKVAALVPSGRPGRGLVPGKLTSSGRSRGSTATPTPRPVGDGVDDLVKRATPPGTGRAAEAAAAARADHPRADPHPGRAAGPPRPAAAARRRREGAGPGRARHGLEPHLLVYGDSQSGKSAAAARPDPRDHPHRHPASGCGNTAG